MKNKLRFGTDGIRGKSDQFPFTPNALNLLGRAIARWGKQKYRKESLNVLLGHDTRESCEQIKKDLILGLSSHSTIQTTDGQILPTPAVLQRIQAEKHFDFGIVISASHNPYTDNGIKLFDAKTGKLSADDEASIVEFFELPANPSHSYAENIISRFKPNFLANKKIVLDCANGATYKLAPEIFEKLGASVITLFANPNGKNINTNCGALFTQSLQEAVLQKNADIGFAFDGDGDRVIAVNKHGIVKNGDDFLAILLDHPDFAQEKTVVGTVMTNHGLALHLKQQQIKLIRTQVGDKNIAAYLEKENLLLGGEASGHLIIKNYLNTGDGIYVALKVLESLIINKNLDMQTFTKMPHVLVNIPVKQKRDLDERQYQSIINKHEKQLHDGRLLVRYSGTENLLRVMVEDQSPEHATTLAKSLSDQLQL
ncbi:hypothetical protein KAT92_00370, partial [Candidatus Babeliales bacterium]|nr:hypothetical protein [Candidatus Babeliales bacterium]